MPRSQVKFNAVSEWTFSYSHRQHKYWTLKVHINTLKHNQEREVLQHLSSLNIDDPGRQHVRRLEDSFKLKGPHGEHDVFIMTPLGMSLRTLQGLQKTRVFHPTTVKNALNQTLVGLSFLHDSGVIHTGKHLYHLKVAKKSCPLIQITIRSSFR